MVVMGFNFGHMEIPIINLNSLIFIKDTRIQYIITYIVRTFTLCLLVSIPTNIVHENWIRVTVVGNIDVKLICILSRSQYSVMQVLILNLQAVYTFLLIL